MRIVGPKMPGDADTSQRISVRGMTEYPSSSPPLGPNFCIKVIQALGNERTD